MSLLPTSMLNYIVPPIIIVIATSVLVIFLFKKARQIPMQEITADEIEEEDVSRMSAIGSSVGQFWLKILERMMHRLKLISLKFHNISNDCFHSIRERRQRKTLMQKEMEEKKDENFHRNMAVETTEFPVYKRRHSLEKISGGRMRESMTAAQARMREKNKFENILIKRIAINPKDIEAYERLGDYYLENENYQDSIECFRQVLKLSPLNYKARLRIRRLEKLIK